MLPARCKVIPAGLECNSLSCQLLGHCMDSANPNSTRELTSRHKPCRVSTCWYRLRHARAGRVRASPKVLQRRSQVQLSLTPLSLTHQAPLAWFERGALCPPPLAFVRKETPDGFRGFWAGGVQASCPCLPLVLVIARELSCSCNNLHPKNCVPSC